MRQPGDPGHLSVAGPAVMRRADLDADHDPARAGVQGRAQRSDGLGEYAGRAAVQQAERLDVAGHRHRRHDLRPGGRHDRDAHGVSERAVGDRHRHHLVQGLLVHPHLRVS
jgi:hypothetical protein